MVYREMVIMFGQEGACEKSVFSPKTSNTLSPICLYLYCEDVDSFCEEAQLAGALLMRPPEDTFWGDRMCQLADIDGYHCSFATLL